MEEAEEIIVNIFSDIGHRYEEKNNFDYVLEKMKIYRIITDWIVLKLGIKNIIDNYFTVINA